MILPRQPKELYQCVDGTYSTHARRGACNWHGGLKTGKPVPLGRRGKSGDVQMVALEWVNVAHTWFQNRTAPFSTRSVNNIILAVQSGSFRWANMDAVTLWRNPADQKLYVLSGHSRHEAFRQLCAAGLKAEGRAFCEIPAKIVELPLAIAKKVALESNTLSTKETDLERATFYRRQKAGGADEGAIVSMAKRLEGRNAKTILAYSALNPAGRTWSALQALESGQADSRNVIRSIGRWIGNARLRYAQLTNAHEDELFLWLVNGKGYGTSAGQVNSEAKFVERLTSLVNRRSEFGRLAERLNIQANIQRSPVEQQYNAELLRARGEIQAQEKALKEKTNSLAARGATESDVARITAPIETALRRARLEYRNLVGKRDEVAEAARNQKSLFAIGGTVPGLSLSGVVLLAGAVYLLTR